MSIFKELIVLFLERNYCHIIIEDSVAFENLLMKYASIFLNAIDIADNIAGSCKILKIF